MQNDRTSSDNASDACHECARPCSRRDFLSRAASSVGVVLLGTALSGCFDVPDEDGTQTVNAQGTTPSAPVRAVAEGTAFRVSGAGELKPNTAQGFTYGPESDPGIVFAAQDGTLRALSARCTHAGCAVNWTTEGDAPHLHCPCHASNFDLSGKVLNGPANAPLPQFKVRKEGRDALVTPPKSG